MKKWESLQKGDLIDVVAPGSVVPEAVLQSGVKYLEDLGYRVRVSPDIFSKHIFHSNSDEYRFKDLKKALYAKDSKAIWCIRGGYGSLRLLPYLEKLKAPKRAKIFIGISDVTSIHNFLIQNWKWPVLHGTLLDRLGSGKLPKDCEMDLWEILEGRTKSCVFSGLQPLNKKAQKCKKAKGLLVGGNLTVIQSSVGTPSQLKTKGCLIFFEDLSERGYRIDRMLEHLKQAGVFKNCAGIIFGQFTEGQEKSGEDFVPMALKRFADEIQKPVWTGLRSGHDVDLWTLPMGEVAVVSKVEKESKLVVSVSHL